MACVPRARRRQAALGPAPLRSCACAEPPRALPLAPHVPQGRPPPWPPEPSAAVGFPAAQIAVSAARLSKTRLPRALRRRPVAPPLHAVPVPFPEKRRHEECRSPCAAKFRPTPCKSDAGDFSEEIKISGVGSSSQHQVCCVCIWEWEWQIGSGFQFFDSVVHYFHNCLKEKVLKKAIYVHVLDSY